MPNLRDSTPHSPSRRSDESELNPAGSARRRLLKALGLGAVATTLSIDWQRPAIRIGALPAHAQSTVESACTLFFTATAAATNIGDTGAFSLALIANMGAYSNEATWTGETQVSLTMSTLVPLGGERQWAVIHTRPSDSTFSFFYSGECCTFTESGMRFFEATGQTEDGYDWLAVQPDPGACSFDLL